MLLDQLFNYKIISKPTKGSLKYYIITEGEGDL